MANPSDKDSAATKPKEPTPAASAPATAPEKSEPSVPATLAERLIDALQRTVSAGSAKPAEGVITTDEKSRYLAELAAYECLNNQADAVSRQINSLNLTNARIRMVDSLDVIGDDLLLQQMLAELKDWQGLFADKSSTVQTMLPSEQKLKALAMAATAGAGLAASLLTAVPSILGLFRSDLDLKGHTVATPSRTALQMRVAKGISNATLILPQLRQVTDCTLLQSFLNAESERRDFSRLLDQLNLEVIEPLQQQIAKLNQQISELKPDDTAGASSLKGQVNLANSELQTPAQVLKDGNALLKEYNDFRKQATAAAEGGKPSLLQRACSRSALIDSNITHLLYVEPVSMGGTEVIAKSWMGLGAPSLHYLGGCVVSFVLTNVNGELVAADTCVATSQMDFKMTCRKRIKRLDLISPPAGR